VIATLTLLPWATTASAECAWIVWLTTTTKTTKGGLVDSTGICASYATLAECVKKLDSEQRLADLVAPNNTWRAAPTTLDVLQNGRGQSKTFHCLPDTVDPRGPKGK
jgi:hypothetical protein